MSARHLRVRMEPVVTQLMMVTAVSHVLQDGRGKIVMKVWYKTKLMKIQFYAFGCLVIILSVGVARLT